jgi:hypothetical protein
MPNASYIFHRIYKHDNVTSWVSQEYTGHHIVSPRLTKLKANVIFPPNANSLDNANALKSARSLLTRNWTWPNTKRMVFLKAKLQQHQQLAM